MKNNALKLLFALFCAAILGITGCSDDSGGGGNSEINYDVPGTGDLPTVAADTIIKNKVVNLNDSADTYYEYLEFTSETGGNYSVYKKGDSENTKVTVSPTDETTALPTTFTYDATSGKITTTTTVGETATTYTAYMFSTTKDGADAACIASDVLATTGDASSLMNTWTGSKVSSVTFNKDGTAELNVKSDSSANYVGSYTNSDGWIYVSPTAEVPLFFGKIGANTTNTLYYLAYQTERSEVEAAGRAALGGKSNVLEITTNGFLLCE